MSAIWALASGLPRIDLTPHPVLQAANVVLGVLRLDLLHPTWGGNKYCKHFRRAYTIELDPVYTVKLMHGVLSLAEERRLEPGTRLLALHGGGLQGARTMAPSASDGS